MEYVNNTSGKDVTSIAEEIFKGKISLSVVSDDAGRIG